MPRASTCRERSEEPGIPPGIRAEWRRLCEVWGTCAKHAGAAGATGSSSDRAVSRIVEHAPVALSVVGRSDSLIKQVNHRFRVFGIGDRDVIGLPVSEFYVDGADRERLLISQRSGRIDMEIRFRRPDESVFWAIVSSVEIEFGAPRC